jgi:hypothetical protein
MCCHLLWRGCLPLQVCYSWWCMSCLAILDRLHWIDQAALTKFILYCQVSMYRLYCLLFAAAAAARLGVQCCWWSLYKLFALLLSKHSSCDVCACYSQ